MSRKKRNAKLGLRMDLREPESVKVLRRASGELTVRHRFASPEPLPLPCTPCHVCGAENFGEAKAARCRMCGSGLKNGRFVAGARDMLFVRAAN